MGQGDRWVHGPPWEGEIDFMGGWGQMETGIRGFRQWGILGETTGIGGTLGEK